VKSLGIANTEAARKGKRFRTRMATWLFVMREGLLCDWLSSRILSVIIPLARRVHASLLSISHPSVNNESAKFLGSLSQISQCANLPPRHVFKTNTSVTVRSQGAKFNFSRQKHGGQME